MKNTLPTMDVFLSLTEQQRAQALFGAMLNLGTAVPLSPDNFDAPAAETAAMLRFPAPGVGLRNVIDGILWSYSGGTPTTGRLTILYGVARTVADGVTATNTALTSATAAFTANDVGRTVTGSGIVAGTKILSVTNATTVVLSKATTGTATGVSVTITPLGIDYDITSPGPGPVLFGPIAGGLNDELTLILAAGGTGITGKLNVFRKWIE